MKNKENTKIVKNTSKPINKGATKPNDLELA
jgi:hypothetical protein